MSSLARLDKPSHRSADLIEALLGPLAAGRHALCAIRERLMADGLR